MRIYFVVLHINKVDTRINKGGSYMYPYNRSNLDWIMVQSVDQVSQVLVQPNNKAWIMVQNAPIFAVKTADQLGIASTELYTFSKYEPEPKNDYVTRDELKEMLQEVLNNGKPTSTKSERKPATKLDED